MSTGSEPGVEWAEEQIALYAERRPYYELMGRTLEGILGHVKNRYAPLAIVQVRTKGIPNFAEKAFRKWHKYNYPVNQFTDLCGARVVVTTEDEMRAVCGFLREHFTVDEEEDTSARLAASEFGYRSVHYIVSFKPAVFPTPEVPVDVPEELLGMPNPRAEVQVRTLLQHAWSSIAHDLIYKAGCEIPDTWNREVARIAAMLETADETMTRCVEGLRTYTTSYGAYLKPNEIDNELRVLRFVREHDPENASLAKRIADLERARDNWDGVIEALLPHKDASDPSILRELGYALCQTAGDDPVKSAEGRALLEQAGSEPYLDAQALSAIGGRYRGVDDEKAREYFRRAFEIAPADPCVLENHLSYEISSTRSDSALTAAAPAIEKALATCRARSAVGVDLPRSYFSAGGLELLSGRPHDALTEFAKGLGCATENQLRAALSSLERLRPVRDRIVGWDWAWRLLVLGLAARYPTGENRGLISGLATPGAAPLTGPVAILAGTCDPLRAGQTEPYRRLVVDGFHRYRGTIIGGGTTEGVSGFVGEITETNPGVHSVAHLPNNLPFDATRDSRYSEFRLIEDVGFTPLGPIQAWIDIVSSGIEPASVVLIGLGGGRIAAIEYRVALSLGATVALFEDGARASAGLRLDRVWGGGQGGCGRLIKLPLDSHAVTALLEHGLRPFDDETRERLAEVAHERYRAKRLEKPSEFDSSMVEWDDLDEKLKKSNRQQADDMWIKMEALGFVVEKAPEGEVVEPIELAPQEIERLAVMEHARWVVERLLDGWRLGPNKDTERKISPHLVEWEMLSEGVRDYDRNAVSAIPEMLAAVGIRVRRV